GFYVRQGTQTELSLTGIGESLMHPRFFEAVAAARAVIGPQRPLIITTNGILLNDAACQTLKEFSPQVFISLHRPEKAGPAVEAAKRAGIFSGANPAPSISAFDWAGQVKWFVSAPRVPCDYLRQGWGVVLVDGRVTTCCLDATGGGSFGTVWDKPESLRMSPWKLCESCHMEVPT
ncbi:MAG: radical SAM protein, partial [Sulfuritalea sp.]|nr:radical SAM protein [Sulfuritalea sp.]